jgi:hypothetical protein
MNQNATERQRLTYNEIAGGSLERIAALLSVWSTYASIGFIIVLQLYYAIAPRLTRPVGERKLQV